VQKGVAEEARLDCQIFADPAAAQQLASQMFQYIRLGPRRDGIQKRPER
jgi:hypothetical protein